MRSDISRLLSRLLRDERGTSFEGIALSVAIVAVAFVASADMLDYVVKKHAEPAQVALSAAIPASATAANLDTAPTASLPTLITRSVLDPCTGRVR